MMKLKNILSECWTGYKQVGLKNKGGRQVPNCVPESVTESSKDDIIKDLDKAKNDLLKKVDILIAKKKKLYSNVDIETPMSSDEKKLDKDIADLFSDINKLVLQKRSLKESVNEGKYYVGYNKGRGQGMGVFKDSYSTYNDAKKEVEKLEKQRGGSYNMIAYYVADKDGKFVRESVSEGKLPGMYVKFLGASKKVRELEDAQKELAKKYFDEKDLNKKEALLKQLKKGTEELKSRRRNLQDIEQTYITGLDRDAELSMED